MEEESKLLKRMEADDIKFHPLAFPTLSAMIFIKLVTWSKLRPMRGKRDLGRRRIKNTKRVLHQLHLRHYMHNVLFRDLVTPRSIMYQFILSRADENIRLAVSALTSSNQLAFYMAMRSQFELNAHTYYLANDQQYAQRFHKSPEDRIKDKGNPELVKNIMTLVQKFECKFTFYKGFYDHCSALIHPNPSTSIGYIKPAKDTGGRIKADINRNFETQWYATQTERHVALEWFDYFLKVVEHLLRLFDDLDENIEVDSDEVKKEAGGLGLFLNINRRLEVLNLRAKMEGWSRAEYQSRYEEFLARHATTEKFKGYGGTLGEKEDI